jgi:hypothetical protein
MAGRRTPGLVPPDSKLQSLWVESASTRITEKRVRSGITVAEYSLSGADRVTFILSPEARSNLQMSAWPTESTAV